MRALPLSVLMFIAAAGTALAQSPPAGAPAAVGPDGKPVAKNANPCRDEVATALGKLRKSAWFRMTTSMLSEKGPTAMTVDYVLPDKMHQKVTEKLTGNSSEVILIGLKAWANQGKGWVELPHDITSTLRTQMYDNVVAEQTDVGEYVCKGKASIEGRDALSYRLDEEVPADADGKSPRNEAYRMFYIDALTGLPVSTEILSPGREKTPIFRAIYTYPIDMKIEAPKDVAGALAPAAPKAAQDDKK